MVEFLFMIGSYFKTTITVKLEGIGKFACQSCVK